MRQVVTPALVLGVLVSVAAAGPVSILTRPTATEAAPGSTLSSLFLIRQTEPTPIFGYSLDIDVVPEAGASSTATANIDLPNFFEQEIQHIDLRDWRAVHTRFDKGQSARSDRFAPTPRGSV